MAQSLSNVLVHFIYSTKNRFPFLVEADSRRRMHAYIARVFREHDSPPIEVGGTADHVHVLCSLSRNHSMSELVRKAKINSTGWVKSLGGMLSKFAWQGGYGAFSIHSRQIEQVKNYILSQEDHHRVCTFQEEYLNLLREYGVAFDERFIWT